LSDLWIEDYLEGIESELRGDMELELESYLRVLEDRPGSFWASYRAAGAECKLGDFRRAAGHLRVCVQQHPENAVLHRQFAGCLLSGGDYLAAEREYERARCLDPEHPETYLSRAFLHVRMKQTRSFLNDLLSYEGLKGFVTRPSVRPFGLVALQAEGSGFEGTGSRIDEDCDPEFTMARELLAQELMAAQQNELALEQFNQILLADPINVQAQWGRAQLLRLLKRPSEADAAYEKVVYHPQVESWIQAYPPAIYAYVTTATRLIECHRAVEAVAIAKRGVFFAEKYKRYQDELHLILARAYAHASQNECLLSNLALEELKKVERVRFKRFEEWLDSDSVYQPYRTELARARALGR
jgi:tetratricopeptide (TPR) repeat protein